MPPQVTDVIGTAAASTCIGARFTGCLNLPGQTWRRGNNTRAFEPPGCALLGRAHDAGCVRQPKSVRLTSMPAGATEVSNGVSFAQPLGVPGYNAFDSAWGDYDNDGLPDLLIGRICTTSTTCNGLYHNDGAMTFTEIQTSISQATLPSGADVGRAAKVAWGDYDNDGYLDALVGNSDSAGTASFGNRGENQNYLAGSYNELHRNNRDGTFTMVMGGTISAAVTSTQAIAFCDTVGDGWLDVLVGNWLAANELHRNNRDGTFTLVTDASFVQGSEATLPMSIACGDFDGDGSADVLIAHQFVWTSRYGLPGGTPGHQLHINRGDGTFMSQGTGTFFAASTANAPYLDEPISHQYPWGEFGDLVIGDYDADGDLDILVTHFQQNMLFANDGNAVFTLAHTIGGIGSTPKVAFVDYDGDGTRAAPSL